MYICNLEKMKKHIGGYTEEILKLIDKYISKTKEL